MDKLALPSGSFHWRLGNSNVAEYSPFSSFLCNCDDFPTWRSWWRNPSCCGSFRMLKGQTAQVTPASSTWPQLVLAQPGNLHWWMVSSVPVQATSSIQIRPVPAHRNPFSGLLDSDMRRYQKNLTKVNCLLGTSSPLGVLQEYYSGLTPSSSLQSVLQQHFIVLKSLLMKCLCSLLSMECLQPPNGSFFCFNNKVDTHEVKLCSCVKIY